MLWRCLKSGRRTSVPSGDRSQRPGGRGCPVLRSRLRARLLFRLQLSRLCAPPCSEQLTALPAPRHALRRVFMPCNWHTAVTLCLLLLDVTCDATQRESGVQSLSGAGVASLQLGFLRTPLRGALLCRAAAMACSYQFTIVNPLRHRIRGQQPRRRRRLGPPLPSRCSTARRPSSHAPLFSPVTPAGRVVVLEQDHGNHLPSTQ